MTGTTAQKAADAKSVDLYSVQHSITVQIGKLLKPVEERGRARTNYRINWTRSQITDPGEQFNDSLGTRLWTGFYWQCSTCSGKRVTGRLYSGEGKVGRERTGGGRK